MVKLFLSEKKNLVKLLIAVVLSCTPFVLAEIFWFKGAFIAVTTVLALGASVTLVNVIYRQFQTKYLKSKPSAEFKFYTVSDTEGAFERIIDGFDVSNKSKQCRIMNALESLPIFFIAVLAVITATLNRPFGKTWALCIGAFFFILNINIYLSFLYKNSVAHVKEDETKPQDNFNEHFLLSKRAVCFYAAAEAVIFVIGLLNVFFDVFNAYGWLFIIGVAVILPSVFAVLCRRMKKR